MALTDTEKRFIRWWDEQRRQGKKAFVATYTFGYTIVVFMMGVALGLFTGLRLITATLLISLSIISFIAALMLAFYMWQRNQLKMRKLIQREMGQQDLLA